MNNSNIFASESNIIVTENSSIITGDFNATNTEFTFNYFVIERPLVIHTGAGLTYLIILLNSFVTYVFLKKENISPSTIPLAALAVSDGLTSTLFFLPKHFGYLLNQLELEEQRYAEGMQYIKTRYPFCVFYSWSFITLSPTFHTISILITALISAQKAVVLAFPFWSKIHMTNRLIVLIVIIVSFIALSFGIPTGFVYNFRKEIDDACSFTNNKLAAEFLGKIYPKAQLIFFVTSLGIMLISTIYICLKLSCLRKSDKYVTPFSKDKLYRMVLIPISITVIYCIFDSMYIICSVHIAATNFEDYSMCSHGYWQYNGLANSLGYAANYVVYLCFSERIRQQLSNIFKFHH